MKYVIALFLLSTFLSSLCAQTPPPGKYSRADTLRGSITPERAWWNVLHYDITIQPDFEKKFTSGNNVITYKVRDSAITDLMQIDLQSPLHIDSIKYNAAGNLSFTNEGNVWWVKMPIQKKGAINKLQVFYSGHPKEAIKAPWDGGWTFTTDSLGRPWMTVTCQGIGASVWYPCKDHLGDEPDQGAIISMIVPDTLVAVSNGRPEMKKINGNGTATYKWLVESPINNYDIIPYIGVYKQFGGEYNGEKGLLTLNYWVLDYHLSKAKEYMPKEVYPMLNAFEYWFGPYPFYRDGYKLVEAPHLGMEHQSAVAYGNRYAPGYYQKDLSGSGWGLKWDFIIVHESGHEWFGNNITGNDLADLWIHESFTNYSETLYTDYVFGEKAGNEYNYGTRQSIKNDINIIPPYGVNAKGSGDMYPKGGNMLHSIRHSLGDDSLFRRVLRGMNKTFYHKTVDTRQIINYFNKVVGRNYSKVFEQYLSTTMIPRFEYNLSENGKLSYRYNNAIDGFDLPLVLKDKGSVLKLYPANQWKSVQLTPKQQAIFDYSAIERMYYVTTKSVDAN